MNPCLIPLSLPSSPPPLIKTSALTTSKTRRRYCGFFLALVGFIYYILRTLLLLIYIGTRTEENEDTDINSHDVVILVINLTSSLIGVFSFFYILEHPRATLKPFNFYTTWQFCLIPFLSIFKLFIDQNIYFSIESSFLFVLFFIYIYALCIDGRSSSILACLKPYRYQLIPLILTVTPSSGQYPHYTIPPTSVKKGQIFADNKIIY